MKFANFKLTTIYAYTSAGNYVKLERMLVDAEKNKLIFCRYILDNAKAVETDSVECLVLEMPMTQMDGGVEVSYSSMVHKLNSGHCKKVQYNDIVLEFNQDFSIIL